MVTGKQECLATECRQPPKKRMVTQSLAIRLGLVATQIYLDLMANSGFIYSRPVKKSEKYYGTAYNGC